MTKRRNVTIGRPKGSKTKIVTNQEPFIKEINPIEHLEEIVKNLIRFVGELTPRMNKIKQDLKQEIEILKEKIEGKPLEVNKFEGELKKLYCNSSISSTQICELMSIKIRVVFKEPELNSIILGGSTSIENRNFLIEILEDNQLEKVVKNETL